MIHLPSYAENHFRVRYLSGGSGVLLVRSAKKPCVLLNLELRTPCLLLCSANPRHVVCCTSTSWAHSLNAPPAQQCCAVKTLLFDHRGQPERRSAKLLLPCRRAYKYRKSKTFSSIWAREGSGHAIQRTDTEPRTAVGETMCLYFEGRQSSERKRFDGAKNPPEKL